MTEWNPIEYDWAYYVDMRDFSWHTAKKQVPVEAIVLEKEKQTLDDGRGAVITNYYHSTSLGLSKLGGKREATETLVKKALELMKQDGRFPPMVEVKRVYKNGNADLAYEPSEYDWFTLRLTPELVGERVEDFLDELKPAGRTAFRPSDKWKVEPAKSSRSKCRTCGNKIDKGTLRIGEPSYFQDHLTYRWHHLDCIAEEIWGIDKNMLEGFENLDEEQKSQFEQAVFS